MGNFYTDVIKKDPRFNGPDVNVVVCDMNLLEPGFRASVVQMQAMAKAAGHELKVAETYRSQARQEREAAGGCCSVRGISLADKRQRDGADRYLHRKIQRR